MSVVGVANAACPSDAASFQKTNGDIESGAMDSLQMNALTFSCISEVCSGTCNFDNTEGAKFSFSDKGITCTSCDGGGFIDTKAKYPDGTNFLVKAGKLIIALPEKLLSFSLPTTTKAIISTEPGKEAEFKIGDEKVKISGTLKAEDGKLLVLLGDTAVVNGITISPSKQDVSVFFRSTEEIPSQKDLIEKDSIVFYKNGFTARGDMKLSDVSLGNMKENFILSNDGVLAIKGFKPVFLDENLKFNYEKNSKGRPILKLSEKVFVEKTTRARCKGSEDEICSQDILNWILQKKGNLDEFNTLAGTQLTMNALLADRDASLSNFVLIDAMKKSSEQISVNFLGGNVTAQNLGYSLEDGKFYSYGTSAFKSSGKNPVIIKAQGYATIYCVDVQRCYYEGSQEKPETKPEKKVSATTSAKKESKSLKPDDFENFPFELRKVTVKGKEYSYYVDPAGKTYYGGCEDRVCNFKEENKEKIVNDALLRLDNSGLLNLIVKIAKENGVNPADFLTLCILESKCDKDINKKYPKTKDLGLFQISPKTAKGYGVSSEELIKDPIKNAQIAMKVYKQTGFSDSSSVLAAVAYNAGRGNINAYGGVPLKDTSQGYVAARYSANSESYHNLVKSKLQSRGLT